MAGLGRADGVSGRKKGAENKVSADTKAMVRLLCERNMPKLEQWLDRIAVDDPKGAFDSLMKVVEYHLPKLGRIDTTVSGDPKAPLATTFVIAPASIKE